MIAPMGTDLGTREFPECIDRCDAELCADPALCVAAVKASRGQFGDLEIMIVGQFRDSIAIGIRGNHLFRRDAGDQRRQVMFAYRSDTQIAGRNIAPGKGALLANPTVRRQEIVGPGVQEAVFGQGSRRHEPNDIAFDDCFGATLLGLCRVFELFADGRP